MTSAHLLAQAFAAAALALDVAAFQFRKRSVIIGCMLAASALLAAHFALLGQSATAMLVSVSVLRYCVSLFTTARLWMLACMAAAAFALLFDSFHAVTTLALIGSLVVTYAVFQRDDYRMRVTMIFGVALWVVHNMLIESPLAALIEFLFLSSNLVGFWRFHLRPKRLNAAEAAARET